MFLSMIIFNIICFGVYYDYMFSIVDLPLYSCMESYRPHLDHLLTWVNGKDSVSVVLILYSSMIAPYISGRVVDHGGDSIIESSAVHPPCIGLWSLILFGFFQVSDLIFLDSLPMH
jgi:hypothetical protein